MQGHIPITLEWMPIKQGKGTGVGNGINKQKRTFTQFDDGIVMY